MKNWARKLKKQQRQKQFRHQRKQREVQERIYWADYWRKRRAEELRLSKLTPEEREWDELFNFLKVKPNDTTAR